MSNNNNSLYESQIRELNKQLNDEKNKNQTYINTINTLSSQINLLKQQLNDEKNKNKNKNNNREITYINPGEKIMAINFVSMGNQDITNYNIICKNKDLFIRLEEKLYQDFPQFKDYETYFEVRTKRIKRFKTIEENDIRNNDVISVFRIDN